jgi:hypothetical protein
VPAKPHDREPAHDDPPIAAPRAGAAGNGDGLTDANGPVVDPNGDGCVLGAAPAVKATVDGFLRRIEGDARRIPLDEGTVDLVATSPPYWKKRNYGIEGQIGFEHVTFGFVDRAWGVRLGATWLVQAVSPTPPCPHFCSN